jgi:hypothetical protein
VGGGQRAVEHGDLGYGTAVHTLYGKQFGARKSYNPENRGKKSYQPIHESKVSRDERNEYFGITLERVIRILEALNVRTKVEAEPSRDMISA